MGLLGDQTEVTSRSPLKVRRLDDTSVVTDVSAETVTFQYDDSGALASATGEAAGTMVYAKLDYDGILNSFKDKVGDMKDSSFSFVTGSVLTTALTIDIEQEVNNWRRLTVTEKFTEMAKYMQTNGQYWVDHADGAVWGIAAVTVADDTANYSYKAPIQGSGGPASNVNINEVGGVATAVDDAAFTEGTTPVLPAGFVYDDSAALDSGDVGAARVTSDRRLITAGYDDTLGSNAVDITNINGEDAEDYIPSVSKSFRANEIYPLNEKQAGFAVVDTTNLSAATHYFPSDEGFALNGTRDWTFSGTLIDADNTIAVIWQICNGDPSSDTWVQIYGSDKKNNTTVNTITVTSGTVTFAVAFENLNYKYIRAAVVAGDATNTAEIYAHKKSL